MINSFQELEKKVDKCVEQAMKMTRDIMFEIVSQKVWDYYHESVFRDGTSIEPAYYDRTGTLMESLTASNISKIGGQYYFTVGFDDDYLTFKYPGNKGRKNIPATGYDVLTYFNDKSHGGTVAGEHRYWDEAIDEINARYGSIGELFKKNLKATGLPIN